MPAGEAGRPDVLSLAELITTQSTLIETVEDLRPLLCGAVNFSVGGNSHEFLLVGNPGPNLGLGYEKDLANPEQNGNTPQNERIRCCCSLDPQDEQKRTSREDTQALSGLCLLCLVPGC